MQGEIVRQLPGVRPVSLLTALVRWLWSAAVSERARAGEPSDRSLRRSTHSRIHATLPGSRREASVDQALFPAALHALQGRHQNGGVTVHGQRGGAMEKELESGATSAPSKRMLLLPASVAALGLLALAILWFIVEH